MQGPSLGAHFTKLSYRREASMCTQTAVALTCVNIIFEIFCVALICPIPQFLDVNVIYKPRD